MKESDHRPMPVVSVIIPTHNRCASLMRMLDALCSQTHPLQEMEVLVVADGCTDGTVEMLNQYKAPFALRLIKQPGNGAAAARNQGAAQASGKLLLFLDDDVEPTPSLVGAHVNAHQGRPNQVVIGPYPPVRQTSVNFFRLRSRAWWETQFNTINRPGHRFTYRDLLSGNLSLEANLFVRVGGFDTNPAFKAHEDYEFGIRLIETNAIFNFAADAVGYHHEHETTDLARIFRRTRQEGRADVTIGERHPELQSHLAYSRVRSFRLLYRMILGPLVFTWPTVWDFLILHLQRALFLLERTGLQRYWELLYQFLHFYWYWRGVTDKLNTWSQLSDFVEDAYANLFEDGPICQLDLQEGLEAAIQHLDAERPAGVRLYYGQQPIGFIRPQPGAEPLRGVHLRPILANTLTVPLLEAMALEGALTPSDQFSRQKLFKSIRSKSIWFGPTDAGKVWYEQYSQWNRLEKADTTADQHLSDENWEQWRIKEYERLWLAAELSDPDWRVRLFRILYECHRPFYHWYTSRGWAWLGSLRQRVRQRLLSKVEI